MAVVTLPVLRKPDSGLPMMVAVASQTGSSNGIKLSREGEKGFIIDNS